MNNFSLDLYCGRIFALLGHNGAGKTSLIKIISGTEEASNGDIFMDGQSGKELFRNGSLTIRGKSIHFLQMIQSIMLPILLLNLIMMKELLFQEDLNTVVIIYHC